jgi:protein-S-isoprenylcysteine O-methyltransferase Ste14
MKRSLIGFKKDYTERQRVFALIPMGALFVVIIPFLLHSIGYFIDVALRLPYINMGLFNFFISPLFIIIGLAFAGWSVWIQFEIGKGTPAPIMPTCKLIKKGPYAFCRNPMILGTVVFYLGIALLVGSISAIALIALFMLLLVLYVKVFEEKELERKFGLEYIEYKNETPFLMPVRTRNNHNN